MVGPTTPPGTLAAGTDMTGMVWFNADCEGVRGTPFRELCGRLPFRVVSVEAMVKANN